MLSRLCKARMQGSLTTMLAGGVMDGRPSFIAFDTSWLQTEENPAFIDWRYSKLGCHV